ncbi:MAG: hypothetical protein ACOCOK_03610, partial [Prevotella sp.]
VWRSSSNSVAVVIQQCGGSHPTVWRSPSNSVAVAIQQYGSCHNNVSVGATSSPINGTKPSQTSGLVHDGKDG